MNAKLTNGSKAAYSATKAVLWCLLLGLAAFGIYGCWLPLTTFWPGLHQDGANFSTVAINLANGLGTKFDVYLINFVINQGNQSFNWHGQLYYPVASLLMQGSSYESFLRLLYAINLVALFLSFIVFALATRRSLAFPAILSAAFGIGGAYATVGLMQYLQGRPEHGIPLVLLLASMARELTPRRELPGLVNGLVIGVIAAISPLPGILMAIFSVFVFAAKEANAVNLLLGVLARACVALVSWCSVMLVVYPWSFREWFQSTRNFQNQIYDFINPFYPDFPAFNVGWVTNFWFTMPFAPGLGALFLLAAATALFLFVKTCLNSGQLLRKLLLAACLIVPLPQIWWSGIGGCPLNYSLICFFPAVAVWLLEQMRGVVAFRNVRLAGPAELRIPDWISRSFVPLVLLFAVSWPGLGFARTSLMQDAILKNGVSYAEALARFEELKSQLGQEEVILIDLYTNPRSAVVFDGPPWKSIAYEGSLDGPLEKIEEKLNFRGKYIFYLQAGNEKSPERAGFKLIETNFNFKPVEIFGKTIRSTTPGYGYAIYERIEPHASDYNSVQQVIKE